MYISIKQNKKMKKKMKILFIRRNIILNIILIYNI